MKLIFFTIRYLGYFLFRRFKYLGWPVSFSSGVRINNPGNISLGNHVCLDNHVFLQAIHGNYKNAQEIKVKIEDKVTIGMATMISAAELIEIKKNVLISQFCFIADHDHEYRAVEKPIREQGLKNVKPVIIKEGAWVGAHSTITSGVTIGKNAVIGANSLVNKDIPDYSVAVGVPAKVIKQYNFKTKKWERV